MEGPEAVRFCQAEAPSHWKVQQFSNAGELRAFGSRARDQLSLAELNHDLEWLQAGTGPEESIVTIADVSGGDIWGMMAVRVSQGTLEYMVGKFRLFKLRLPLLYLTQGIPTRRPNRRAAMINAIERLANLMPSGGAVYLNAVPSEGELHALLSDANSSLRRTVRVLAWGGPNWHCKIDWTGSVEAYLASLGADSRRNLKRYTKKLFSNADLKATIRRFTTPTDVSQFLADGVIVSAKTYQKDLGLGLSRGGPTECRALFAAEHQSFLGHILYLQGAPVAFHYGYIFGQTFFSMQMGYDPEFSHHQSGSVLFFSVLQDLERLKVPVRVIDNLPSVTLFKLRTSNRKELIQNFYLFKRTARGFALYAPLKALGALARGAKKLMGREAALEVASKPETGG